jgi:hypothetical protein
MMPFVGEPGEYPLFNEMIAAGDSLVPCLIDKVTDSTIMRDPGPGPTIGGFTVGDAAFRMIIYITREDQRSFLPEEVRAEWEDHGIYAYYKFRTDPNNRKLVQKSLRKWYVCTRLSQPVSFEFECEPLREALKAITAMTHIDFLVDEDALQQVENQDDCSGKAVDEKQIFITAHAQGIPLESALERMLKTHGLAFSQEEDYILVSTPANLQESTSPKRLVVMKDGTVQHTCLEWVEGPPEPVKTNWEDVRIDRIYESSQAGPSVVFLIVEDRGTLLTEGGDTFGFEVLRIYESRGCAIIRRLYSRDEKEICIETEGGQTLNPE